MTAAREKRLEDQLEAHIVERPADGFPPRIGNLEEGKDEHDFVVFPHFFAEFSSGDEREDDEDESDCSCSTLPEAARVKVVSSEESGYSSRDAEEEDAGDDEVLLPNFRILWDLDVPEEPLEHEEDAGPRGTSRGPYGLHSSEDEDESDFSCSDLPEAAGVQMVSSEESGHSSWDTEEEEDTCVVEEPSPKRRIVQVLLPNFKILWDLDEPEEPLEHEEDAEPQGTSPRPFVLHISEDEGEDCSFSALLEAAGVQVVSGEESADSGCFEEDLAPLVCPKKMNAEEGFREEQSPQEPTPSSSGVWVSKKRRREEGAEEEECCVKKIKKKVPQEKLTLRESSPSTPGVSSSGRPEAEEDFEDAQPSTSWGSTWGRSLAWWFRPRNESDSDSD
ncbi:uncharacterized protein LOC105922377 [Fundulus heteroclitus]|uniref:uncharacterized protein LOC105922377 n=1 Tax=Fundulus heteroclitus TaxID=8078 RepID=UPI00165A1D8B|nr:uncharacterized protein LOC105922377 [Fundulus heteroclitus]